MMHAEKMTVKVYSPPKLPTNTFMNWLRNNLQAGRLEIDFSHHPHQFVSDMIEENDIESWKPQTPVLISTQTGTGKTKFVIEKLLKRLIETNSYHYNAPPLLAYLSNRIALNRQSKEDFADSLQTIAGITAPYEEIKTRLTNEGIDKKTNFGPVDLFSYQQFHELQPLHLKKYLYVVCDEVHFFTSDAPFNPCTDEILKKITTQCSDAVRVYISATPDVAFEAIIRQEYRALEVHIQSLREANQRFKNGTKVRFKRLSAAARNDFRQLNHFSEYAIDSRLDQEIARMYPLKIKFYYGERNYDYIEKITTFKKIESITDTIKTSNEKWIIFVSSKATGKKLLKKMTVDPHEKPEEYVDDESATNETEKLCIFLSRDAVNNCKKAKDAYDYLIAKESFNADVLITTSLLDNGINITDARVVNVVIDVFNRTEFLQMLGRIRVKKKTKINLFIHNFDFPEIQALRLTLQADLLQRLKIDLLPIVAREKTFKKELFFYTHDPDTFCDYNPCAIYELIDNANRIADLLKNAGQMFTDESNSPDRALLYNYHKLAPEGANKSWSRSLVDLLESADGELWRKKERQIDSINGEFSDRYDYHFQDSFTRYIFNDLIPNYYMRQIEKLAKPEVISKLNSLNDFQKNRFKIFLQHNTNAALGELSYYETLKYLSIFMEATHCGLSINLGLLNEYAEKATASKKFAEQIAHSSIEEQLLWIEKPDAATLSLDSLSTGTTDAQTLEEHANWIQEHALSKQDIESHRLKKENGSSAKYFECKFLEAYGVPKDSDRDFHLAQDVFHKNKLTECLHQTVTLNGCDYALESYTANTQKHPVFYLFVIAEKNSPAK